MQGVLDSAIGQMALAPNFIVLPEFSLTSPYLPSRQHIQAFAQQWANFPSSVPTCSDMQPARTQLASVVHLAQCWAKSRSTYLLLSVPTTPNSTDLDPAQPSVLLYNSLLAIAPDGAVAAMYHKQHLYGDSFFTPGPLAQRNTFQLPDGRTAGMILCFDLLNASPGGSLLHNASVDIVAVSSWWVNVPPLLMATQAQMGWAALKQSLASAATHVVAASAGTGGFNSGSSIWHLGRAKAAASGGAVLCTTKGSTAPPLRDTFNDSAVSTMVMSTRDKHGTPLDVSGLAWYNTGLAPRSCVISWPEQLPTREASPLALDALGAHHRKLRAKRAGGVGIPLKRLSGAICQGPAAAATAPHFIQVHLPPCLHLQMVLFNTSALLMNESITLFPSQQPSVSDALGAEPCSVTLMGGDALTRGVVKGGDKGGNSTQLAALYATGSYNQLFNTSMCGVIACASGQLECFEGDRTLFTDATLRNVQVRLAGQQGVLPQIGGNGGLLAPAGCAVDFQLAQGGAGGGNSSLRVTCKAGTHVVDAGLVAVGGL